MLPGQPVLGQGRGNRRRPVWCVASLDHAGGGERRRIEAIATCAVRFLFADLSSGSTKLDASAKARAVVDSKVPIAGRSAFACGKQSAERQLLFVPLGALPRRGQAKIPTAIAPPSAASYGAQGPGALSAMNGGLVAVGGQGANGTAAMNTPGTLGGSATMGGAGAGAAASGPNAAAGVDRYGLLALLSVIRMSDSDLTTLAIGSDLTTLGLNLNSQEYGCVAGAACRPHSAVDAPRSAAVSGCSPRAGACTARSHRRGPKCPRGAIPSSACRRATTCRPRRTPRPRSSTLRTTRSSTSFTRFPGTASRRWPPCSCTYA